MPRRKPRTLQLRTVMLEAPPVARMPTVCVAASRYFADKFEGLAAQFGAGCEVVHLGDDGFGPRLSAALDRLWDGAPGLRDPLIAAAARQVELSREAFSRLPGLTSPVLARGRR